MPVGRVHKTTCDNCGAFQFINEANNMDHACSISRSSGWIIHKAGKEAFCDHECKTEYRLKQKAVSEDSSIGG